MRDKFQKECFRKNSPPKKRQNILINISNFELNDIMEHYMI